MKNNIKNINKKVFLPLAIKAYLIKTKIIDVMVNIIYWFLKKLLFIVGFKIQPFLYKTVSLQIAYSTADK